ncbi:DNA polymerase IV [Patescibacteria group bacterium]|nr:DNA polymerase IV [Patescibacteria group bacterium]
MQTDKASIIAHIDMNSYFASCEQQANPHLRGKPVGVCAYLSANGCIIASSIEAKQLGIKTGFRVKDALLLCPDIVLIQNEPAKYRTITSQIFSILADYTDEVEPYSIDEAFLDLTGHVDDLERAKIIGLKIKKRIKQEIGEWLKSSMGIAGTRWLAKFGSDIASKDDLLVIRKKDLEKIFAKVKLTDAWGINKRTEIRLNALGIYDLNDLKNYPVTNLMQALGKNGYYLWANVNGIELTGLKDGEEQKPKSIGHSYCLPKRTTDKKYLNSILLKLCEKTGRRLRAQGLEAKQIYVGWGYVSGNGMYKQQKLAISVFDTIGIYKRAAGIFNSYKLLDKVRFLAVSVSNLIPLQSQTAFWQDLLKPKKIAKAMDRINDKFGEYSIMYGSMHGLDKNAQERIGFRKSEQVKFLNKNRLTFSDKEL